MHDLCMRVSPSGKGQLISALSRFSWRMQESGGQGVGNDFCFFCFLIFNFSLLCGASAYWLEWVTKVSVGEGRSREGIWESRGGRHWSSSAEEMLAVVGSQWKEGGLARADKVLEALQTG